MREQRNRKAEMVEWEGEEEIYNQNDNRTTSVRT